MATVATLLERLVAALQGALLFVGILAGVYLPGRFLVVPLVSRVADAAGADERVTLPLLKVTGAAFALLGVYLAIPLSGLATTPTTVAAVTAGATVAIGFASRDVLANLVSGAFIVLDPKFNIGDWIRWDDNEGIVEDVSFRVTRVHTFDNELITVPNSRLATDTVVNPVAKDRRRIAVEVGVGYDDDVEHARAVLLAVAAENGRILDRPAPSVVVTELAPSYVGLRAWFWVAEPSRANVVHIHSEFVQAAKERLEAEGVEIPYPYRHLTGAVETGATGSGVEG